jgi:hypothetical protein
MTGGEKDVGDEPGAPDPRHPIVTAALALCGVTPDDVTGDPEWEAGRAVRHGGVSDGTPRLVCARDHITVHLRGRDDDIVLYVHEDMADKPEAFWLHHLEFRNWMPPDILLPTMVGRTLDQVADIPGGSGLVIVDAVEMAKGLVLTLAPPGMTSRTTAGTRRRRAA